ncbi:polymer-forming cytoskeletal protein [Stutzerimonas urumqiensis]|uniref:bactofilin family protein n=1 Tax=Stutzerimonas urumqiensis TaxID=638269 RepID=UPI003DA461D2
MFKKDNAPADLQRFNGKTTVIAADAQMRGDLIFDGAVQVDGRLYGTLATTEGLVRVSQGGTVEGTIRAPFVVIDGEVTGDVEAIEHLELGSKARVRGNLSYGVMVMAAGASVEGELKRLSDKPAALTTLPAEASAIVD